MWTLRFKQRAVGGFVTLHTLQSTCAPAAREIVILPRDRSRSDSKPRRCIVEAREWNTTELVVDIIVTNLDDPHW